MAQPQTGPFMKSRTGPFDDTQQSIYRQARPYNMPLPYRMQYYFGRYVQTYSSPTSSSKLEQKANNWSATSIPSFARLSSNCYNQAYERLRAQASDQAGWAENLAQIDKTRKMVVDRCVQLGSFVKALRRADFSRAARALRTPIPSSVSNRKAVSQNFLEWEYGVKPVVSDIQSSMKILLGDPSRRSIYGRAVEPFESLLNQRDVGPDYVSTNRVYQSGYIEVTCRAIVRIDNPNLALANSLGLLDLALPWKLIPFSFVVDWFVNVEQVISSVTDWYGMTLEHPHYTRYVRGQFDQRSQSDGFNHLGWTYTATNHWQKSSVEMDRIMGLPSPSLVVKPFKGFSMQRGAQALALVIATLGK